MKMDVLKCKTVDGVLRELHVFALIYNLIRQVMLQAAERQRVPVTQFAFLRQLERRPRPPAKSLQARVPIR